MRRAVVGCVVDASFAKSPVDLGSKGSFFYGLSKEEAGGGDSTLMGWPAFGCGGRECGPMGSLGGAGTRGYRNRVAESEEYPDVDVMVGKADPGKAFTMTLAD